MAVDREMELLFALKPFAEYAEQMEQAWGAHDDSVYYGVKRPGAVQIKYGDFRRALSLLRRYRNGEGSREVAQAGGANAVPDRLCADEAQRPQE